MNRVLMLRLTAFIKAMPKIRQRLKFFVEVKEAIHSNQAMASIITEALENSSLPNDAVQLIPTTEREALNHLLSLDDYVHCIIPRGGEGLIRFVAENNRVPVIKHYKGVCNLFVDASANLEMAEEIAVSSKCGRPGVCNAIENLIVESSVAEEFLPRAATKLLAEGCELITDEKAGDILRDFPTRPASDEDFAEEFLDLRLSIKIVNTLEEAIAFINEYGSGHSESIITTDENGKIFSQLSRCLFCLLECKYSLHRWI